ncbi:MAG: hypothetical protein P8008_05190 [Gammaproteobacteria bacterium]
MSLFAELKRRNVFRVGIAYVLVGWLVMQIGEVMAPALRLPGWVLSALAFFLILGFPVALVLAWALEITPEGVKLDRNVARKASIRQVTGRRLDQFIIVLLALAIAYIIVDKVVLDPSREQAVAEAARAEIRAPIETNTVRANSIAVLPFENMSGDSEQDYFSNGIAEELLNLLTRIDKLEVASRTSSFAYQESDAQIPRIAEELQVSNILQGGVRKAGNRVRITAQLVDAVNDRQLWSESYDRELTDIFAIQEEIANAIVAALRNELKLEITDADIRVPVATRDMTAYDLYLRAHDLFINRERLDEAVNLLQQAVAMDSNYAEAWEALAATAVVAPGWGYDDRDYYGIAQNAAETAIALDERRSVAWAVLGNMTASGNLTASDQRPDTATGVDQLSRAIAEDPRNASAWLWRGVEYSRLGFHDDAASDIRQCLAVDPAYLLCLYHLGLVESLRGNRQALHEYTERMLEAGFDHHIDQHTLFFGAQGDHLTARLMTELMPDDPAYPKEAFLEAMKDPGGDQSEGLAQALAWLETDRRVGAGPMLLFALRGWDRLTHDDGVWNHWIWSPLHPDFRQSPDFKRLVRAMGLDRYWREREFPPQCRPVGNEDFECD